MTDKIKSIYKQSLSKILGLVAAFTFLFLLPQATFAAPQIDYKYNLYDIFTATTTSKALDVTTQETNPTSLLFNNTGTKLYVLGKNDKEITQYNLSTPYDIFTATTNSLALSVSVLGFSADAMLFNNTGTRLYVMTGNPATNAGSIWQFNLGTAYDISTGVWQPAAAFDVSPWENAPTDMMFNNNGTVLYTLGTEDDKINKFTLSTAYNISTATYTGSVLDVTTQETTPRGMTFNSDGYRLYVIGNATNQVRQYNLITAYDISTASYISSVLNVSAQDSGSRDIIFNNLGDKVYVLGESGQEVNQYTLGTNNNKFSEAVSNNGSVTGGIVFTLNGDTFNDPDNNGQLTACGGAVTCAGHQVNITNLPAGLTPTVTLVRADSFTVNILDNARVGILTLTGNATNHQNANDIAALTFTFANSAFNVTSAAGITRAVAASAGVGIDFADNITYPVTYDGNSSTGGTVPVDGSSPIVSGATVTVLGNTGSLVRTGFTFNNWNTAANGSGTSYAPAATFSVSANTTLYAQWTPLTSATVVMLDNLTNESGDTGSFSIVLDSAPSANVTIPLSSSNLLEGTVPASVAFTTVNWNVPQIITVTGVDDVTSDGSQNFNVITGDVTSADPLYDALDGTTISNPTFSNQDNDAPGIVLTVISNTTTEAGVTATIQVSLLAQPAGGADVTIPLSISDATEGSVPASITILNANWNTPTSNVITVTGLDDAILDGDIIYTLVTGDPTSADPAHNGLTAASVSDVSLTNIDNDVALIYNGNSNTGGSVPTDASSPYTSGATVTVLGNTGSLVRTGFVFNNWNTAANGSGTSYTPAATFSVSANTTLYAQWTPLSTYTLIYNGNSNTGGSVPTDVLSPYNLNSTVTVLGNTGSLVRTGLTFNNWNTAANGSGTAYASADAFAISTNTTLYAQWADTTTPSDPIIGSITPNPAVSGTLVTLTLSGVEVGASITVDDFTCTPSPADITGNVTCTATAGPAYDGLAKQVTVTDASGNANGNVYTSVVTITPEPSPAPSVSNIGSLIMQNICNDTKALNYSNFGLSTPSLCIYANQSKQYANQTMPAPTSPDKVCTPLLTIKQNIEIGKVNNTEEVKKLEAFLNTNEGEKLEVNGIYEQKDLEAVNRFQQKHFSDIIKPFGGTKTTGIVGPFTRGKINVINCVNSLGCPYFSTNQKIDSVGGDVKRIQNFLNTLMGISLTESGKFDQTTFTAVKNYQNLYKETVLKPLGLKSATGLWYEKSRASGNSLMGCSQ